MNEQKNTSYAMWMHLCGLLGWFILPIFHIIIMHVVHAAKAKDDFADHHGREAIRFQWMMLLYNLIISVPFVLVILMTMGMSLGGNDPGGFFFFYMLSAMWSFLTLFWLPLLMLVLPIRAAMKAHDGLPYAYPFVWSPRRNAWNAYKYAHKPAQHHNLP